MPGTDLFDFRLRKRGLPLSDAEVADDALRRFAALVRGDRDEIAIKGSVPDLSPTGKASQISYIGGKGRKCADFRSGSPAAAAVGSQSCH